MLHSLLPNLGSFAMQDFDLYFISSSVMKQTLAGSVTTGPHMLHVRLNSLTCCWLRVASTHPDVDNDYDPST